MGWSGDRVRIPYVIRNAAFTLQWHFAVAWGIGIAVLMGGAFVTHLRVKNPVFKMLPSLTLLVFSVVIAWINYRLLAG
ncbi:MAG: hypothetical protein AB9869_21320 [Verrucomicrobiia bacterium]